MAFRKQFAGKAYLKINLLVKTPLHRHSMEVRRSGLWAPAKIKIHNSKISANLDLSHSSVFNVIFSSLNFCVGDIKHIRTTENKLDLARVHTSNSMGLFCFSPQSPPRKLSILTSISKPCPPFTAVCEETSPGPPIFFPGICYEQSNKQHI